MLGRTLHASGSAFRMLPNPTAYHWEKKSFSMWKLLLAYQHKIEDTESVPENEQIMKIKKCLELIFKARGGRPESEFTVAVLDALHQSLDSIDNYLTNTVQEYLVVGILRVHFETVLQLMNSNVETPAATSTPTTTTTTTTTAANVGEPDDDFDRLKNATPEQKQIDFISIYFDRVRTKAVNAAPKRRFTTPTMGGSTAAPSPSPFSPPFTPNAAANVRGDADDDTRTLVTRQQTGFEDVDKLGTLNTIWCSLVLRMLCWLLLHDFHKNDVQISKSELLGSRLPVYIV